MMNCRDAGPLLPLFFDGELDAHQMRAVALHSTRCLDCEGELRRLERMQDLISAQVSAAIDDVDLSGLWSTVEPRLKRRRRSWLERIRSSWGERAERWTVPWPALAAVGVALALGLALVARLQTPTTQPGVERVAAVDNEASLDSLDTDAESVVVLSDPETRTMVLWVSDDEPLGEAR